MRGRINGSTVWVTGGLQIATGVDIRSLPCDLPSLWLGNQVWRRHPAQLSLRSRTSTGGGTRGRETRHGSVTHLVTADASVSY